MAYRRGERWFQALKNAGIVIERTPDMTCAKDRKRDVIFIAKPVCAKRVLN
jgi:hypothetical protein